MTSPNTASLASYSADLFKVFDVTLETADPSKSVVIHGVTSNSAANERPGLLLLHGHPQTHHIWHKIAPLLIEHFQLVIPDLRGHGESSKPNVPDDAAHEVYSKRSMAQDQISLMKDFGFEKFYVVGHDRGGRVAHRLALDYPDAVLKLIVLDIAPTLAMYNKTDQYFAKYYWHWFFLIQQSPVPEEFLLAAPSTYLRRVALASAFHTPTALQSYQANLQDFASVHAMCEDYRASGPGAIDLTRDVQDVAAGRKVRAPLKVLWGANGVIEKCFDAIAEWKAVSESDVTGGRVPTGHYIPEGGLEEWMFD